jgi:RHS repeat-associated protein
MKLFFHTLLTAGLLVASLQLMAQETPDIQRGLQPYGSIKGGDLDSVNMINGNLTLHIPILSYPQRGKSLRLNYNIYYNDKQYHFNYTVFQTKVSGYWALYDNSGHDPGEFGHLGAYVSDDQFVSVDYLQTYALGACVPPQQNPCSNLVTNYYVNGPDDSRHYYGNYANAYGVHSANVGMAVDNSGYLGLGTSGPIIDRQGTVYTGYFLQGLTTGQATDVDGNYIAYNGASGVTDTLGRVIPAAAAISVSSTTCSAGTTSATVWNVPGSTNPYYFCYTNLAFQTAFNAVQNVPPSCNLVGAGEASGTGMTMLTEVILPNSTRYKFAYDSYLSLTQLTLPTGGYISYTWKNQYLLCNNSSPLTRVLATRTKYDGTTSATWHYQWIPVVGSAIWQHVVTDPMGNDEVHLVSPGSGGDGEVDSYSGCSTINSQYCSPSSGTRLKQVLTSYQTTSDFNVMVMNQFVMPAAPIPSIKTVILGGGSGNRTSKTTYALSPLLYTRSYQIWPADASQPPTNAQVNFLSGQIATVTDYDYGAGSAGGELRSVTTKYKWQDSNGTSYVNQTSENLLDLPWKVVTNTADTGGNQCAETDYTYDEPSYLTTFGGTTTNHGTPPSGSVRGNATTVQRWLSSTPCQSGATGNFISTHANIYDTGEDYQDTDARGNITTHTYDSAYYGAYRTKTQMPDTGTVHHIVSGAYDLATGLITTFNGQNAYYGAPETTTYAWDFNMRRIASASFPDLGLTTFCYSDTGNAGGVLCSQTSAPYQVTMKQNQTTSTPTIAKVVLFDLLGRSKQTQLTTDPIGTDFTDTSYDADGRVATASNPYRTAASNTTDGTAQTTYDGAGRPIVITKQDGATVQTSYLDTCTTNTNASATTVTDEQGNQRRTCSDALGRLIEVDEPGYGSTPATSGTGSVAIAGTEQGPVQYTCGPNGQQCQMYDQGQITVTVNGTAYHYNYGQNDTYLTISSTLASTINAGTLVYATASNGVISLTAKTTGSITNYSLTTSVSWNTTYFAHASFTATPSGSTLTGGTDAFTGISMRTPWLTYYTYDALGNLLCVEQHGNAGSGTGCSAYPNAFIPLTNAYRARQFFYDSFSRLTKAQNPESGTINYTYDNNGNLLTKTDARNITITYAYDADNRLTGKTYSNSDPAVSYTYDAFVNTNTCGSTGNFGIGRRTGMTDASGSSSWTYDLMGRVWKENHTIGSVTNTIANCYNYDGSIAKVTYPAGSGSVITYTYDAAPHLTTVKDTAHSNFVYMSASAYYPPGELNQATYGGVTETNILNNRLQPCWYHATTTTILPANTGCAGTGTQGTILDLKYSYTATGFNDNGNVMSLTNNKSSDRSVTYTYDALNRIASAATPNTDCSIVPGTSLTKNWGETTTIDAWGSLSARTVTKCSADGLSVTALTNNQLSGFGYDSAGNMTSNGGANYTYNGESQLATAGGATYTYDGDGNRVKKSSGTLYWGSGALVESDLNGTASSLKEYIMAGGRRIARRDNVGTGNVFFYLSDNLGSSREIVASGASSACYDADFYPYGGERAYVNTCPQNYKFTGKERDSESGLDNFGARYDTSNLGRFMTPDWAAKPMSVPYAKFGDPQSLNLYAYVRNNPLSMVDPTGHYLCSGTDCVALKVALEDIKAASKSKYLSKDEKSSLKQILSFYGKEHKDNGVTVNTGPRPSDVGGTKTENGRTTIALDLAHWDTKGALPNGGSAEAEKAAEVAHEGEHGVQQKANGMRTPGDKQGVYSDEQQAYTVQSLVNKGLQVDSAFQLWTTDGFSSDARDFYSLKSTDLWCHCDWKPTAGEQ